MKALSPSFHIASTLSPSFIFPPSPSLSIPELVCRASTKHIHMIHSTVPRGAESETVPRGAESETSEQVQVA